LLGIPLQPLDPKPALIDRAYERLVAVIADGTLTPGQRIRQEGSGHRNRPRHAVGVAAAPAAAVGRVLVGAAALAGACGEWVL
jgi:hypothetical protein